MWISLVLNHCKKFVLSELGLRLIHYNNVKETMYKTIVTLAKDMLGNRGNHISYDDLTDNISADVPVTFIGVFWVENMPTMSIVSQMSMTSQRSMLS